jgi:methionyl-tRNA formyltransferase
MASTVQEPFRAVLCGAGSFGLASFRRVHSGDVRGLDVALAVSAPDRPSGRGLRTTATPVSQWARGAGIPLLCTEDINSAESLARIAQARPDVLVVVSFGQKIGESLLSSYAAFNLHGSLLPAWRGAAPVQRALMAGDREVGISVIGLAARMDAGPVYATARTSVGESETAGELHDRLAELGAEPMVRTLTSFTQRRREMPGASPDAVLSSMDRAVQDESCATRARKLSRADAWVDFGSSADAVRARINGLAPWPGCDASLFVPEMPSVPLRILRARVASHSPAHPPEEVGLVSERGTVRCRHGEIELLEAQVPGGKAMHLAELLRGRRIHASAMARIASVHRDAP